MKIERIDQQNQAMTGSFSMPSSHFKYHKGLSRALPQNQGDNGIAHKQSTMNSTGNFTTKVSTSRFGVDFRTKALGSNTGKNGTAFMNKYKTERPTKAHPSPPKTSDAKE